MIAPELAEEAFYLDVDELPAWRRWLLALGMRAAGARRMRLGHALLEAAHTPTQETDR